MAPLFLSTLPKTMLRTAMRTMAKLRPMPRKCPLRGLAWAIAADQVAAWDAHWIQIDANTAADIVDVVANALPMLSAQGFRTLDARIDLARPLARVPMLAESLRRTNSQLLDAIPHSAWIQRGNLVSVAEQAMQAPPHRQEAASVILAIAADHAIAAGQWGAYTEGLASMLMQGHLGAFSWAKAMDLPVAGCLPLRERMAALHGTGVPEPVFRLALLVANARTGHATLRLNRILDAAGKNGATALFNPAAALEEACLTLPSVAPSRAA